MTDEERLLAKRFTELRDRALYKGGEYYSDFLSLAAQDLLTSTLKSSEYTLDGGYGQAERRVAVFGGEKAQICVIEISPTDKKFADELTHRDFLGALMSLGIKRGVLGDIVVFDNSGYLFCLCSVSDYIIENLTSIRHTKVKCIAVDSLPVEAIKPPVEKSITAASLRADAVVAEVYNLSRSQSSELFSSERVTLRGSTVTNSSYQLKPGDLISVRGYGRFIYAGTDGETRKGKLKLLIKVFK